MCRKHFVPSAASGRLAFFELPSGAALEADWKIFDYPEATSFDYPFETFYSFPIADALESFVTRGPIDPSDDTRIYEGGRLWINLGDFFAQVPPKKGKGFGYKLRELPYRLEQKNRISRTSVFEFSLRSHYDGSPVRGIRPEAPLHLSLEGALARLRSHV